MLNRTLSAAEPRAEAALPCQRFQAMIGTGGIGSGSFFLLDGKHTLQREESRPGRFLERQDYCKLHIISHYVKTLMVPGFEVLPFGKVGADDVGSRLLEDMEQAGLNMANVEVARSRRTLFSFCFIYPDGAGGNMTTADSASARVSPSFVAKAAPLFSRYKETALALAVPEVPLAARVRLLELATRHGAFRAASFTSAEIPEVKSCGILECVDLLALNLAEAAMLAGIDPESRSAEAVALSALKVLSRDYAKMAVSITAGSAGSWVSDAASTSRCKVFPVPVKCTAGAGDAHLSGILAGFAAGLSLHDAHVLGALTASLSVTSPHTINEKINLKAISALALKHRKALPPALSSLLHLEPYPQTRRQPQQK